MKSEKSTFFQMGEPSVNPETLENAMNGDNYGPQTAIPAFFLLPGIQLQSCILWREGEMGWRQQQAGSIFKAVTEQRKTLPSCEEPCFAIAIGPSPAAFLPCLAPFVLVARFQDGE